MIAVRGNELLVIKDSEAAQYVRRQKGRGAGFGRFRHNQPTRDHIYQFRTRIPQLDIRGVHSGRVQKGTILRAATLQGKIIGLTGTVELYKGKPEIKVLSMTQIKGVDSQLVQ